MGSAPGFLPVSVGSQARCGWEQAAPGYGLRPPPYAARSQP